MSPLPDPFDAEPVVTWVRERDVDLVLADTISSRPDFATWLLRSIQPDLTEVREARALVSYNRPDATPAAMGESDILVRACLDNGSIVALSIEDKVAADSQPAQPDRHRAFVASIQGARAYAVVIAPGQWIDSHEKDAAKYHAAVRLEDVAEWHREHDLVWRADLLAQACKQDTGITIDADLSAWAEEAHAVLVKDAGIHLGRRALLRTTVESRAKSGRFLNCHSSTLVQVPGAGRARLVLKTSTGKYDARADIKVVGPQPWLSELLNELAFQAGFGIPRDGKNGRIITKTAPAANEWTTTKPIAEQLAEFQAVAAAAKELRDWWNTAVVAAVRSR